MWDSIDLDAATSVLFPNEHRWDYIVSVPHKSELVGIEPHSATDGEIRVVTAKKRQAADFLRDHLLPHHRISKWLWVSHGKVGFSKMERARRILDQNGITFAGRLIREF